MLKELSAAPPVVALIILKMKCTVPQDVVGGFCTFQLRGMWRGTSAEMSKVGIEGSAGTVTVSPRHGE